jgi:predicted O-linked N-acetylglucosamine transferase (SPINDLY family)
MISRQSAALLLAAGLGEWVATGADDYVRRAQAHASDIQALARSRAGRRARVAASPLADGPRFARAFAAILEQAAR